MKKFKHVIWDWNGTLLEDVDLCVSIMNSILSEKEMKTISMEYYKNIFTIPVYDYYQKLNFDFELESFESIGKRFIDKYEELKFNSHLYQGAESILKYIHEAGVQQSVLSGYFQETLESIISEFQLCDYFDHLVGMNDIYAGSKITNGKKLIELLNLNGEDVIMVGDTCHDYEVACEIGAEIVLMSNGHQSEEKLKKCGVEIFGNHKELSEFFKNNLKDGNDA